MVDWAAIDNRINRACEARFGSPCVLRPQAGGAHPFTGVYTAANVRTKVDPATRTRYETTDQTLTLSRADVPVEPEQGDLLDVVMNVGGTVQTVTFEVREREQDGPLGWLLSLREVPA